MSVTKLWKVYTPSISKTPSVYWNWSNEKDGTRIFECFNSDLTGHKSYSIIRITMDTEEDVDDEWEGHLSDGFFENYRGCIKGKEITNATGSRGLRLDVKSVKSTLDHIKKDILVAEYNEWEWRELCDLLNAAIHGMPGSVYKSLGDCTGLKAREDILSLATKVEEVTERALALNSPYIYQGLF